MSGKIFPPGYVPVSYQQHVMMQPLGDSSGMSQQIDSSFVAPLPPPQGVYYPSAPSPLTPPSTNPFYAQLQPVSLPPPMPALPRLYPEITAGEVVEKLLPLFNRYGISESRQMGIAIDVAEIQNYKQQYIIDNSWSMTSDDGQNEHGEPCTRWEEMSRTLINLTELKLKVVPFIEVTFLNPAVDEKSTPKTMIIRSKEELQAKLNMYRPTGDHFRTPLCKTYADVTGPDDYALQPLLATDGVPSDGSKQKFVDQINGRNIGRKNHVHLTLLACTSEGENDQERNFDSKLGESQAPLAYFDMMDKKDKKLDTVNDFPHESEQIQEKQKLTNYEMTYFYYLLKLALGPINSEYDNQDEKRVNRENRNLGQVQGQSDAQIEPKDKKDNDSKDTRRITLQNTHDGKKKNDKNGCCIIL